VLAKHEAGADHRGADDQEGGVSQGRDRLHDRRRLRRSEPVQESTGGGRAALRIEDLAQH
jgi:hypothetical protein